MPTVGFNQRELHRTEGQSADIYASILDPLVLWRMEVNGSHDQGETTISFENGSGDYWAAIEEWQEVVVQSISGPVLKSNIVATARLVSITSGDGGVTGTIEVAPNDIAWSDSHFLYISHNYPLSPMYPYIDPETKIWYKDRDIPWTDETFKVNIDPILVAKFSQRAGWVRNGGLTFWVDLSDSYSTVDGVTIVDYSIANVWPNVDVGWSIDNATGKGWIRVKTDAYAYVWAKFDIEDSNGNTTIGYRCLFAHSSNHLPALDFSVQRLIGDWESGGWETVLDFSDSIYESENVPDRTFAVLWAEKKWGTDEVLERRWDSDQYLEFINPQLELSYEDGGVVTATFHSGVIDEGEPIADGVTLSATITIDGNSATPSNTTFGGEIELTATITTGPITGEVDTEVTGGVFNDVYYEGTYKGDRIDGDGTYPDPIASFPQELIVGYTQTDQMRVDYSNYDRSNALGIATIEKMLRNEFMFSIPIESTPSPTEWYEYETPLTIGRAIEFLWRWHSNLLMIANVEGLADNKLPRYAVDFEPGNLYDMANSLASLTGIRARILTDKEGSVHLTPNIQLLTDSERSALQTRYELDDDLDRGESLELIRTEINSTALVYTSGFSWDGTTFETDDNGNQVPSATPHCVVAPSKFPIHSGANTLTLDRQTFENEAHALSVAARLYASANNRYTELRYSFHGDYLEAIDITDPEFWGVNISAHPLLREDGSFQKNLIVRNISATVDKSTGFISVDASFEPEVDTGLSAVVDCPEVPEDFQYETPDPDPNPFPTPTPLPQGDGFGTVYVLTNNTLQRTRDFSATPASWAEISNEITGNHYDFILDPWAPSTRGYCFTSDGLWKSVNLNATTPNWSLVLTRSEINSGTGSNMDDADGYENWAPFISGSINEEDFVCLWTTTIDEYVWFHYSEDGGSTWTHTSISFSSDHAGGETEGIGAVVPHIVDGHLQAYSVVNNPARDVRLLGWTGPGAGWSYISTPYTVGGGSGPSNQRIHLPYNDNDDGNVIYALVEGTVYVSNDGGSTWTSNASGLSINDIIKRSAFETFTNDRLKGYVVANSNVFYITDDGFVSYSAASMTGLSGDIVATGGFPYDSEQFYCVTQDGGATKVWVSIDRGDNWTLKGTFSGTNTSSLWGVIVPDWTE